MDKAEFVFEKIAKLSITELAKSTSRLPRNFRNYAKMRQGKRILRHTESEFGSSPFIRMAHDVAESLEAPIRKDIGKGLILPGVGVTTLGTGAYIRKKLQ